MRTRESGEKTAVVFESASGDFDPAGAGLQKAAQVISLGQGESGGIALSDSSSLLFSYLGELRFRGSRGEQTYQDE